jgi:uncharacterized protein (DUF924 family)
MSNEVLEFWFDQANRRCWFEASPDFDELVRQRLTHLYDDAVKGCLDDWKDDPNRALALCILFDQVARNIFRGSAHAFATDPQALSASTDHTRQTTTACSATCLSSIRRTSKTRGSLFSS